MLSKTQIINSLEKLPETLSMDQLINHCIFLEKVQRGLEDSINHRLHSKEIAIQKFKKWLR